MAAARPHSASPRLAQQQQHPFHKRDPELPRWPGGLLPPPAIPYGTPIRRAPPNADGHIGGGPFGPSHDLMISQSVQIQPGARRPQSARQAQETSRQARAAALAALYESAPAPKFARYTMPSAMADRVARRPQSARGPLGGRIAAGVGHFHPATPRGPLPTDVTTDDPSHPLHPGRPPAIYETHTVLQADRVLNYVSVTSRQPRHFMNPSAPEAGSDERRLRSFSPRAPRPEGGFHPPMRGPLGGRGRVGRSRGLGGNPIAWRPEGPDPEGGDAGRSEHQRAFTPMHGRMIATNRDPLKQVGIPTEVYSMTEQNVHDYTHKMTLSRISAMRYA